MPSAEEPALLYATICLRALALWGVVRPAMLDLAVVGAYECKRESSARVDYVPALCTHRPSLLPIEWSGEVFGLRRRGRFAARDVVRSPLNLII
ncbi:hypothetical protein KIW84_UN0425 [Lathyrus oleraceus]|nr:hypothetical protein KIW84_UN0425 [Pisum sativum]